MRNDDRQSAGKGATVPNENETPTQGAPAENAETTSERTFTQAELDSIVKERLKRDREKYADYDALKAKAEKYDAAEEASKSELQKAVERAEALKAELDGIKAEQARQALIAQVAKDSGVDAELLAAMRGSTEDEIKAHADLLKAKFAAVPGYKADPHDQGGTHTAPPKRDIPIIF